MNKLESAFKLLLTSHPFYAHMYLGCKVSVDKYPEKDIPTASVLLNGAGIEMTFCSKFLDGLSVEQTAGLIEHETLHLVFEHLGTMKLPRSPHDPVNITELRNVAMDCAINQLISSPLPTNPPPIIPATLEAQLKVPVQKGQTWEYYYAMLLQHAPKSFSAQPMDVHGAGGDKDGDGKPIPAELAKALVKDAVQRSIAASKGLIPQGLEQVVQALLTPARVSWKQVLSNFVANATSSTTRDSRKRLNRRFGLAMPGKIKKRELKLGVCEDTSGSVPMEATQAFRDEIDRIAKHVSSIVYVDADCVVQHSQKIKKNAKVSRTRKGGGGTAYQPALSHCKEAKCDAIIYFGDMDSADKPTNPGVPVLWVAVGESPPPADFGSLIRIKA